MNKEKEIEAMAEAMIVVCDDCEECEYRKYGRLCAEAQEAECLYELGYRKADEVRKETAKHIKWSIINNLPFDDDAYEIIDEIFAEYGVEVDE